MVCVLLCSAVLADNALGIPDSEYNALVALYNNTNGPHWWHKTNWLTGNPDWYGVWVADGHVVNINLWNNNLVGEIPAELGALTYLYDLRLSGNSLSGPIPADLGNLVNLQSLNLQANQLSGSIPSQLGNLTNLYALLLGGNRLTGPLPSALGGLQNLQSLDLSMNCFCGEIPSWITSFPQLSELSLNWNAFVCSDPDTLAYLNVVAMSWGASQTMPPTAISAVALSGGNAMVRWSPAPHGQYDHYEVGYSADPGGPYVFDPANRTKDARTCYLLLTGLSSQSSYFVVRSVQTFPIGGRPPLASVLSAEAKAVPIANTLGIPDAEYSALLAFYDSTHGDGWSNHDNWLTEGTPWYGVTVNDGHVTDLTLESNHLSGTLPASLSGLSNLHSLVLNSNLLSGPIPPELATLRNLNGLCLASNQFICEVPAWIADMPDLQHLDLGYNGFWSDDAGVRARLDAIDLGWQTTQTVAPTGVGVKVIGLSKVAVWWDQISYREGGGYYQVAYSQTPGGENYYQTPVQTDSKDVPWVEIDNVDTAAPAYFTVRTVSSSGPSNQSTLTSLPSPEIALTQPAADKRPADGTDVLLRKLDVTVVCDGCFYVENPKRTWGIRVDGEPSYDRTSIFGTLHTDDNGERYIVPTEIGPADEWSSPFPSFLWDSYPRQMPVYMTNRALGGSGWCYDSSTGAGQRGVDSGVGLNNIGLLVKTTGKVVVAGRDWLYIDDGSGLDDGSGIKGLYVEARDYGGVPVGSIVWVTGISSCDRYHGRIVNTLRSIDGGVIVDPSGGAAMPRSSASPEPANPRQQ